MRSSQASTPKQICEAVLLEAKRYNCEHDILYGECAVADRLLARGVELQDAYVELHDKLHWRPPALQVFLGLILSTATFWSPEKNQEARSARDHLIRINQQIAQRAAELAELLEERSNLHDTSGFSSSTHYHICQVIESASQPNYLFQSYVRDKLRRIRSQFDLKYWPSLGQCLDELATDARAAVTEASDPLTAAATSARRASKADFCKALFTAIDENSARTYGQLPLNLRLTDRTLASLTNCALNLGPDELVDEAYMKRLRQRHRAELKSVSEEQGDAGNQHA